MEIATFVIPVYISNNNGMKFLDETIAHLKLQDDENWQAIFINDNSPIDAVKELLKKKCIEDDRIQFINLVDRVSTGECRNIGIEWAYKNNSPIILFNDADDISHVSRVKEVRKLFEDHKEIDVIYSSFYVVDENLRSVPREILSPGIIEVLEAIETPPIGENCWYDFGISTGYTNITSSTSVRTDLAMKEPFPDEYVSEDMHTWFRYAARGRFLFTPDIPTGYRIPSYTKRQSSNEYVDDFNKTKMRVDKEGFKKALDIAEVTMSIDQKTRLNIETKFLLKLAESFVKNDRKDLVYQLVLDAKNKLSMVETWCK